MLPSPRTWSWRPSQEELDGADLVRAQLSGIDLRGRDLSGRDLQGAVLRGADLRNVILDEANLAGADLSEADLEGGSLRGAVLSGARLRRARAGGASFFGANLAGADFTAAFLAEADLSEAVLDGARADAARLEGCSGRGASMRRLLARGAALDEADLAGAVLDEADLSFATMERAVLSGASLLGARLAKARLDGAALDGADLRGADINRAVFAGVRVEGASFEGARAARLRLSRTALQEDQRAALRAGGLRPSLLARAPGVIATWVAGGGPTRLATGALERVRQLIPERVEEPEIAPPVPEAIVPAAAPVSEPEHGQPKRKRRISPEDIFPGADLRVRDLRGFDLSGHDLSGADLRGADLRDMDLRDAIFAGARMEGARFERANLERADLSRASAERASFDDARLANAVLVGLAAEGASFLGARFRGAEFRDTSLIFANLAEADLRACILGGLDVRGARLDRADLTGAVFDGLVASPEDLAGAIGFTEAVFAKLISGGEQPTRSVASEARAGIEARLSRGIVALPRWIREGGPRRTLGRLQGLTEGALARESERGRLRIEALLDPFASAGRVAVPASDLVPGGALAGADLRGLPLAGVDLSGSDLRGALLDGVELTGTMLRGADLSQASLVGARLTNVDLRGASMELCRLDDARLEAVVLEDVGGRGLRAINTRFSACLWRGADLASAVLSGAQLAGEDLSGVELAGAKLDLVNLAGCDLTQTGLAGADLRGLASLPLGPRALRERGVALPGPLRARLAASLSLLDVGRRLVALLSRELTRFASFVREGGLRRPAEWLLQGGAKAAVRAQVEAVRLRYVRSQPEAELLVPGSVLAGMELRRARLAGLDLSDCIFDAADLYRADLRGAKLVGATFKGALMGGVRLDDADLTGADLEGAALSQASLQGAVLTGARLLGVDLERADLVDTDLADADLSGARLVLCDLAGAGLGDARVEDADFVGALGVSDAAARELARRGARVEQRADAVRSISRLRVWIDGLREPEEAPEVGEDADYRGRDLRELPLAGRDLCGVDLREARMEDMDLRGTILQRARLEGAHMARARLDGADLSGARGEGADLSDCHLHGTNLSGFDGREVRLVGASLRGARLDGAMLAGVDLSAADLSDTDLADADLSGARLSGTLVDGAFIGRVVGLDAGVVDDLLERGALLDIAALVPIEDAPGAQKLGIAARVLDVIPGRRRAPPGDLRLGPGVDLSGRDLRRTILAGLDLSGANLREARLDGADLQGTDLSQARMDGARLSGANLADALLVGVAAAEARFDDTDLSGADLSGLRAPGGSFVGATLSGATLSDTSLVDCDLSAADLRGVDLADADLSGALLEQTELEGARVELIAVHGTDLVGALGLVPAQVEALTARGAKVTVFRVPAWLRIALSPRAAGLFATTAVVVMGFVLLVKSGPQTGESIEDEAIAEVQIGEVEAAVSRYEELLGMSASAGERIRIRYEIARVYEDAGEIEAAQAQYRAAIEEAETGEDAAEASLRLANALALGGDGPAERAAYGEVLMRIDTPSALYARALVGLVDSHRAEGSDDRADAAFGQWMGTMDNNAGRALTVSIEMAELWAAGGEYERSLASLAALDGVRLDRQQRARVQLAEAKLHADRGDYSAADELYSELVRNPTVDSGRTRLAAAEVAWHLGDAPRALELLDRALGGRTHPETEARILLLKARLLRSSGDRAAAVALYQRVLDVYSDDEDVYAAAQLGLAESLSDEEQLALVEQLMERGEAAQAGQIVLSRARRLRVTGDAAGAEELYERVLTMGSAPESQIARFELARVAIEDGRVDDGINQLRAIQSEVEGSERIEVEAAIADALRAAGRLEDAEFAYSGLVAGYPAGSEAAVRGLLGIALVAEARGEVEDARRGYFTVLEQTTSPTLRSEALAALAGNYMETGDSDAALKVWRDFLEDLPEGHEAAFDAREAIAQILRARGERQAALDTYTLLLEGTSSAERRARARVAVGELLEEDGRFGDAETLYRELLEDPALPEDEYDTVVVGLIRTLLSLERPEEALTLARDSEVYEEVTRVTMRSLQAQALRALGRTEEARRFEDQVEAEAPELDDAFSIALIEANELVNEWDFEGAVAAYQRLLGEAEDRPTQAMIVGAIAQAKGLAGDLDGARAGYRSLARDFADLDEAVFSAEMGLAWVDRQAGDPEAAVERYAALVGPDPGSEVWRLEQLATTLQEAGDDERSEQVYKDLIRAHPGDVLAQATGRYGLAELMRNRGELSAARGLYEQVARTSPDRNQQVWAELHAAMILVDEGRLDDAEDALDDLIDDSDDDEVQVQAAIGLSSIELERGRPGKALDVLEDIDAESLGGGWVATLTQQRATCLVAMGDAEDAERAWVEVLRAYEDVDDIASQARLALGDLALGRDEPKDAIARYERVLAETDDPHYRARALLGRGDALTAQGRSKDARASYEQVLSEHPEQAELVAIARARL
ncbi:MAG TPA: pentapeptide repeat-containing protein [Myxococcota bacterium]|nr:pentapeptide repeat-containing protein [Myxococcota bacterium]